MIETNSDTELGDLEFKGEDFVRNMRCPESNAIISIDDPIDIEAAASMASAILREKLAKAQLVFAKQNSEREDMWTWQPREGDNMSGRLVCVRPLEKK